MEMTYDYFRILVAFVTQNGDKKYDLPFNFYTILRTEALYPKVGYNPFLVFRFNGEHHISDSILKITFKDIVEADAQIGEMLEFNRLPCYHSFFLNKLINGNYFLFFNDHIEVWKEDEVKIESFDERGVKVLSVTTPKFRG